MILFGEAMPSHFQTDVNLITQADLVIISGTSLKVYPFAFLVQLIPKKVPVVLINFENSVNTNLERFLFIQGDIEENFRKLLNDICP